MTTLKFIKDPRHLKEPPPTGRVVLVDVAFDWSGGFETITRKWIQAIGDRLAGWIDHHQHPAWKEYQSDPRFVLVDSRVAPACPQLITPQLVQRLGSFEHLWAHTDFDGCMTAAKVLRGGQPAYPEADEDARAVDDPAGGHTLSERGKRVAKAIDQLSEKANKKRFTFLEDIVKAWAGGNEPPDLTTAIDALYQERLAAERELVGMVEQAKRPHPDVLFIRFDRGLPSSDKKYLLRELQLRAKVAVVFEGGRTTVATGATVGPGAIDLSKILDRPGRPGYVAAERSPEEIVARLTDELEKY